MSSSSFVNGLTAGAGITLVLMSIGFLYYVAPVENQEGISSTEIRVAIILGALVAVVSIGYEYYLKKSSKTQEKTKSDKSKKAKKAAAKADEEAKKAAAKADEEAKKAAAKADEAKKAAAKAEEEAKIAKDNLDKESNSDSITESIENKDE